MVQIVGKDPAAVKRATCRSCSSILEYTLSEVQKYTAYDYGGGSDIVRYITCPCCSSKVNVNSRY